MNEGVNQSSAQARTENNLGVPWLSCMASIAESTAKSSARTKSSSYSIQRSKKACDKRQQRAAVAPFFRRAAVFFSLLMRFLSGVLGSGGSMFLGSLLLLQSLRALLPAALFGVIFFRKAPQHIKLQYRELQ